MTLNEKIQYFKECLLNDNGYMEQELYIYFFELENGNFNFLNKLNAKPEIDNRLDYIIRMMQKHDHEDALYNIIENYL